ncbi:MAG: hypothetical protein ACRCSS_02950 [Shewanella sp.]
MANTLKQTKALQGLVAQLPKFAPENAWCDEFMCGRTLRSYTSNLEVYYSNRDRQFLLHINGLEVLWGDFKSVQSKLLAEIEYAKRPERQAYDAFFRQVTTDIVHVHFVRGTPARPYISSESDVASYNYTLYAWEENKLTLCDNERDAPVVLVHKVQSEAYGTHTRILTLFFK